MQQRSSQNQISNKNLAHKIELDHLHGASMTGIYSVPTFTDKNIVIKLKDETLVITGQELEIKSLDIESGKLTIGGKVFSIKYSAAQEPISFFKRIFK